MGMKLLRKMAGIGIKRNHHIDIAVTSCQSTALLVDNRNIVVLARRYLIKETSQ